MITRCECVTIVVSDYAITIDIYGWWSCDVFIKRKRKREREIGEKKRKREGKKARVCMFLQYCRFRICKYVYYGAGTVTKGILTRTLGLENVQAATRSATMRNANSFVASLRVVSTTICLWIMQDTHSDSVIPGKRVLSRFLETKCMHPAWVKSSFQRSVAIYESHHRLIIFVPLVFMLFARSILWKQSFISSRRIAPINHQVSFSPLVKGSNRPPRRGLCHARDEVQHLFSPECKFTILLYDKSVLLLRMHLVSEESCQGHNWSITPCVDERLSLGLIFEAH